MNKKRTIGIITISVIIVTWYFLTLNQTSQEALLFPNPLLVLKTFAEQLQQIVQFSFTTWYRVIVGLAIGSASGFILGLLMSYNTIIDYIVDPIIEVIRPIPPVALTPFFILWFGLGDISQFLLISFGVLYYYYDLHLRIY